jgi:hypothetical protein
MTKRRDSAVVVDLTPEEVDLACPRGYRPEANDVRLAARAVCIHGPERWPHGEFCVNCHAPFPCRLHLWGRRVLKAADWRDEAITRLLTAFQRTGQPPWLDAPS